MRIWKIPDQVIRLSVIVILVILAVGAVRQRLVPDSFGDLGHFRADAIPEIAAQELQYAGSEECMECHEDEADTKRNGYHRGLSCETCHGAAYHHVYGDDAPDPTPALPTSREACLQCHSYLPSRPTGFPQVIANLHNPYDLCVTCHDPHDPVPNEIPTDCSACHAQIARTKAVSHHAALACEQCHQASPLHRENPRAHPPNKPSERAFCGQCHARGAEAPRIIPRVDMNSHGGRYVCWQCHYPHFPEGS